MDGELEACADTLVRLLSRVAPIISQHPTDYFVGHHWRHVPAAWLHRLEQLSPQQLAALGEGDTESEAHAPVEDSSSGEDLDCFLRALHTAAARTTRLHVPPADDQVCAPPTLGRMGQGAFDPA
jgi:hypothetical protein